MGKRTLVLMALIVLIVIKEMRSGSSDARTQLTMTDATGRHHTLTFGTDSHASDGFDFDLGEMPIPPPPPPEIFEIRFIDRPGARRLPGDGSYVDLRPVRSRTQVDTFIVRFQTASEGFPVRFTWSKPADCDSMVALFSMEGENKRINMTSSDSFPVRSEGESTFRIVKYGVVSARQVHNQNQSQTTTSKEQK